MIRSPYVSHCVVCKRTVELLCETLKTVKKYYCKVCRRLIRTTNTKEDGTEERV
jgi:hypothetical protein